MKLSNARWQLTSRLIPALLFLAACSTPATPLPTQIPPSPTQPPSVTSTHTLTPSPTYTPTSTPTFTPSPTSTPVGGGSGRLIFTADRIRGFETLFPDLRGELNLFISNWDGSDITPLTTDGLNGYLYIEDISPDGQKILVSSFRNYSGDLSTGGFGALYLIDLNQPETLPLKIADNIIRRTPDPIATWVDESRVVYIGIYGGVVGLYLINIDGTGLTRLSQTGVPFSIFPTAGTDRVYWEGFTEAGIFLPNAIWWSSLDGTEQELLPKQVWSVSPDGETWVAEDRDVLSFGSTHTNSDPVRVQLPVTTLDKIFWSPDNTRLLLCSSFYAPYACYLVSRQDLSFTEIPAQTPGDDGIVEKVQKASWSPDSQRVILQSFVVDEKNPKVGGYATRILDLQTGTFSDEFMTQINVFAWDQILWLP